jgi:hypothetical protein
VTRRQQAVPRAEAMFTDALGVPVPSENPERHRAIEAAIANLHPITGADFAVGLIEAWLNCRPFVEKRRAAPTPQQAAARLRKLAKGLRDVIDAVQSLGPGLGELEQARGRRRLEWGCGPGFFRFPHDLANFCLTTRS